MEIKDTLNLPKTDFPMKANLSKKEVDRLKKWSEQKIYHLIREKFQECPKYILHDGPPYANGHIHIGTALNKILKDIVVKIKTMEGYNAVFIPGWDCHGLPIEHQVMQEIGKRGENLSKNQIRKLCRNFADKYINIQRDEFKRLGVFGDWDNPYLTMSYEYEATIIRELGKFIRNGGVYKGLKPVYWCTSCETALAEAEVEYFDHKSPSIFVKFPLIFPLPERIQKLQQFENISIVIWTTTPWTLPANLAVCLHPDFEYCAVNVNEEILIIAKELLTNVMMVLGIDRYQIIEIFSGEELEGIRLMHPFMDRESPVILGEHVTLEQGTGCVHTAPGHGQEDYEIGLRYGLDVYNPVDSKGRFVPDLKFFGGMEVWKANRPINDKLKKEGYLLKEDEVSHSYPHCWRCKNPIIFRATSQWFISMEKNNLRKKALEKIRGVEWIPSWGEERIYSMIEDRPDWCISRQRAWGVPITVFHCKNCGEILASQEISEHIAKLVEKSGADVWFERNEKELIPEGSRCPSCNHEEFNKEEDILDVWFDSGVSHAAVLKNKRDLEWPADMYLEGSDQHRGWFHSSLLASVGTEGEAPYESVLTHGYVVDGEGKKMSKSAGNVIAPDQVIDKYGAEILRLWVSSENYREDIRISDEILMRLSEAYRRIRNTCRYILGNLYDFDPKSHMVSYNELPHLDRLMLHRLQKLIDRIRKAYASYEFHVFFHAFHNFCTVDLSAFYLDILKDRLYTSRKKSKERRAAQTTIYEILLRMLQLMAPVLSFTTEEVWEYLPSFDDKERSIHLSRFPDVNQDYIDNELEKRWELILDVRGEIYKVLEIARKDKLIGHSLDACVDLYVPPHILQQIKDYSEELRSICIVSCLNMNEDKNFPKDIFMSDLIKGLGVSVFPSKGKKCERCWIISETVGKEKDYPTICERCISNIK